MKLNKLTTVLALLGAALFPLTAHAAPAFALGDFILGFRTTDGSVTNNLEVDLGSYSSFTALEGTGTTVNLTLGSNTSGFGAFSLSDLNSVFTTHTSTLVFGVEGSLGSATSETFISALTATPTTVKTANTYAATMANIYNGYTGTGVAAGSTDNIIATSNGNSYSSIAKTSNGRYNNTYAFTTESNYVAGDQSALLSLYDYPLGATPTKIGTLSLDNGVLTFTGTAAVPEPSTYAMLAAGLVLLVAIRRRNTQNA